MCRRAAVRRTLVETTRAALRNDAAIHALLTGARAYAFHNAGRRVVCRPGGAAFESRDRKAELLAHHCRRRWYQLLVRFFDSLRGGQTAAHGQLSCGLTIDVPPEIWDATNAVIDLITGAVASDQRPSFDRIDVEPQAAELSQRVLSQASCM